nr:MAG TPA: PROTEIN/RNA Complex, archaeal, ribosomal, 50S, protein.0A [Caudoviricetes sp.]
MPDEYISREAALKAANEWVNEACMAPVMRISRLLDKLQKVPAADVAEVVHGRKIEDGDIGCFWLCSLCGECLPYGASYCPNCGAKMDGGADHA